MRKHLGIECGRCAVPLGLVKAAARVNSWPRPVAIVAYVDRETDFAIYRSAIGAWNSGFSVVVSATTH